MKGWLKTNWLLAVAVVVAFGVFLAALRRLPNPNIDDSRYLLSAMAQVIGTVFVLTVAIIQIVGSNKNFKFEKLLSQWYFITTAVVSLFGVSAPMIVLYFHLFCIGTALALGLGVGNLILIGWYIVRVIYAKDLLVKAGKTEEEPGKESILDLKRKAIESLDLDIPSNAVEIMEKLFSRAIEELNKDNGLQVAKDCCTAIRDIGQHKPARFENVWGGAAELLMGIDKLAHSKGKIQFSHTVTLPYLHQLSMGSYYGVRYIHSPLLPQLKEYFWDVFHDELQNKQIDLQRTKNLDPPLMDGLDVVLNFLFENVTYSKQYLEFQDKVLAELKIVIENSGLREHYGVNSLFALVFRLLIDRTYATGEEESALQRAQEFAYLLLAANPIQLLDDSRTQIFSLERHVFIHDPRRIEELLGKLKERLSQPK